MAEVLARGQTFAADQAACFLGELEPALRDAGIRLLGRDELRGQQREHLDRVFEQQILPVLSPQAVQPEQLPLLRSLTLHLAVRLRGGDAEDGPKFAVIPLEPGPSRVLDVPGEDGLVCRMFLEDTARLFIDRFFPGEQVEECVPFRITRNADMSVDDDAVDLLSEMEEVLRERRTSQCVRLEIQGDASAAMRAFLVDSLDIEAAAVFGGPGPIDLRALFSVAGIPGFERQRYYDQPPQPCADISRDEPVLAAMIRGDIVIHHPYEAYDPVLRLIDEAADDPDTLAIKQVLYRVCKGSRVVAGLIRAAQAGKNVTVLIELKARFDEAFNIEVARQLEIAGVQVVHGVRGLKTHAKICLVVRREPEGIRRYMHFGTGNYNESTARLYGDISLLTCDPDLGADASRFFNAITGYSQPLDYRKLTAAPHRLRPRFLNLIAVETEEARQGNEAWIMAKMNSLSDPEIIRALYTASQAGVRIALNIRGLCMLRPGVPGLSDNIRVVSIVDRYLEHSRIFCFHHAGDQHLYISSADWMTRNLDRRVELLVPVEEEDNRHRLAFVLQTYFKDNLNAWELQPDGEYRRLSALGAKPFSAQRRLHSEARDRFSNAQASQRLVLEPVRARD